jgi:hypothetical protein
MLALLAAVAWPGPLPAQTALVRAEENLRAAPNEAIVGVLRQGAEVAVVGRQPGWVEVELEGWVWIRSLQVTRRDGFDLVVVPENDGSEFENLRAQPAGRVLARLERGALLMEEERIPAWIRVRRRAWVWARSVDVREPDDAAAEQAPTQAGASASTSEAAPPVRSSEATLPAADAGAEGGEGGAAGAVRVRGPGVAVLEAPAGDTLGVTAPGADLTVLERRGNWARVRLDGWTWMPDTAVVVDDRAGDAEPVTPSDVSDDPEAWRGRIVTWNLQFIALERAEAVRTDFYEGEPFLLTRPVDASGTAFVYVALPPEQTGAGEALRPLERITVVGRVRVGRSSLTGSPILDLVELRRGTRR